MSPATRLANPEPAENANSGHAESTSNQPDTPGDVEPKTSELPNVERDLNKAIVNNFYNPVVNAGTANIGTPDKQAYTHAIKRSGPLPQGYIDDVLRTYLAPAPAGDARSVLTAHRCVILVGDQGSGRQAGAIALLHDVAPDRKIVLLPPGTAIGELCERTYDPRCVYIAPDVELLNDGETRTDTALLSGTLADNNTYLAATHTANNLDDPDNVITAVAWARPGLTSLIAKHVAETHRRAQVLDQLKSADSPFTLRSLSKALQDIGQGVDIDQALQSLLNTEAAEVRDWFNSAPDQALITDVIVTAFLGPLPQASFERHRAALKSALQTDKMEDGGSSRGTQLLSQERHRRRREHRLLSFAKTGFAGSDIIVDFDKQIYRAATITEIYERYDDDVWRAIQQWLEVTLIAPAPPRVVVAVGKSLGLLAADNTAEVCGNFLTSWSHADPEEPVQAAAVYALWSMCDTDQGAAGALTFCRQWLFQGTAHQVWTASMGFSGEVGRSFPAEAVRRLWQLFRSDKPAHVYAGAALAQLFVILELSQSSSIQVIRQVRDAIAATNRPGGDQELRQRILSEAVEILAARHTRSSVPASLKLFDRSDDARSLLAETWAAVLLNRRTRARAVETLLCGLKSVKADPSVDAVPLAARLGAATFARMPVESVTAIRSEFSAAARRKPRDSETDGSSSVEDLIVALWQNNTEGAPDDGIS